MALNYSSLSFDLGVQYARLSTDTSIRNLASFAFAAWFKVGEGSTHPNQHAYVERQGTGNGIRFRFTPIQGKLQFGFSAKDGVSDTSYTYNTKWDDRWHHAVFSARLGGDNPTYEIILDGVRVADGTLVVPKEVTAISDTAPKGITIGNHSRAADGGLIYEDTSWQGLLDEIVIFNESVNQGDVNTYYGSNKHWEIEPDQDLTNMLAYWKFDENGGSTVHDVSITPNRTGTTYIGDTPTSSFWTTDRPFLGDGLIDTVAPSTPTSYVQTNLTHDGFDASWSEATDNVWVQFYELQVSQFANFATYSAYDTGRSRSMKVRGLLPSSNYYWRVRAFDAELNASNYSTVRSLTTESLGDMAPPEPPTNLSATYVTHSSFRLSFIPSISSDAVGYKVDISPSRDFDTFLTGYRNLDIGNNAFIDVFGVSALTSYYIRVRSYDAFDNESNDSVVLRINTPRQPDVTPPIVATLHEATGVSSTAATLNWEEGIDDTGVAGYYLDVSTSPTFEDHVTAQGIYWDTVDVGNETSYRIEGFASDTTHYYRVRAYDESGNIAGNVETPMSFLTQPPSAYEGGFLETAHFQDTWKSGNNVEPAVIDLNATQSVQFVFDLTTLVGTFESATLRFMPREVDTEPTVFGGIEIRVAVGDLDAAQLGATMAASITQVNEPMEIDITSLFLDGAQQYVVEVVSTSFVGHLDSGIAVENFNDGDTYPPTLVVETDPMTSTQTLPFAINITDEERINDCVNPSFEAQIDPWIGTANTTLTQVTDATDGMYALDVAGTTSNTRVTHAGDFAEYGRGSAGDTITISLDMKSVSGAPNVQLQIEGYSTSGVSRGVFATKDLTLITRYARYFITSVVPAGDIAYYRLRVLYNGVAAPYVYRMDNVLYEQSTEPLGAFTGNTSQCYWMGTANLSRSRMLVPTVEVQSPYIGDSNENNEVSAFFKHNQDETWIPMDDVEVNRVLKSYTASIPPSIPNYNMVTNPSMAVDYGWSGGEYDDSLSYLGARSYRSSGWAVSDIIRVQPNTTYTAQMRVRTDVGATATPYVTRRDASGASAGSIFYGNAIAVYSTEAWTYVEFSFATDAATEYLILGCEASGGAVNVDTVQLNEGPIALPYRDGSFDDAHWEGTPEVSTTALRVAADTEYHLRFDYTDPEGFFDDTSGVTYSHMESFVTPQEPDNVFTATALALEAEGNMLHVSLQYSGDDNEDATVRFEFKRSDLTTWSEFRPTYSRSLKRIIGDIQNLKHGTSYTVRAIITDPDGVYGTTNNVITNTTNTEFLYDSLDTEPHISFGGFTLMGRSDDKVGVVSHDAFGFPTRRLEVEDLPRLDGATELQALWGRKEINMRGFISGDSRADLNDVRTAILKALAPRQQRLVIDTLSHKGRFYNATCEVLDIMEDAEENIRHLSWAARFVCADPFAYDISETAVPTFTAPNNSTISLVNGGDVTTHPQFVLTTTSWYPVTFVIANETTGERIAPKATILNGDRFIIDSERRSMTKNGIEIDYAGTFPRLSAGGNTVAFTLTATSGVPTLAVDVRWRNKFL